MSMSSAIAKAVNGGDRNRLVDRELQILYYIRLYERECVTCNDFLSGIGPCCKVLKGYTKAKGRRSKI